MHCLQTSRPLHQISKLLLPTKVLTISPNYQFLLKQGCQLPNKLNLSNIFNEVLRQKAYEDPMVRENCLRIFDERKFTVDKDVLNATRFLATLFYAWEEHREKIKGLANKLPKCKVDFVGKEVNMFRDSMNLKKKKENNELPSFEACLFKAELINFYLKKYLELSDWKKFKKMVEIYGEQYIDLYECSNKIRDKFKNTEKSEIFELFMEFTKKKSRFSLNLKEFEELKKVSKFCGVKIEQYEEEEGIEYVKEEELKKLIARIEEFAKDKNEGFLTGKELENTQNIVRKMKKKFGNEEVVVVDALNYGLGRDPKNWEGLKRQFKNIVFATRRPRDKANYEKVKKQYGGNVVFCDERSQDDMIVLQIAWEFGPKCRVITNDHYSDHRRLLCEKNQELLKIWDKWMTDMVYRHDFENCEKLRNFNIRIYEKSTNCWIIPVIPEKEAKIRNIVRWKLSWS